MMHPTDTTTSPSTFATARFLLTLFVGPALGALTFLLAGALADWHDNPDNWSDLFEDTPLILLFGYGMGLFPALVGAVAMGVFSYRYHNLRAQLLAAIPLGAAAGWFGMTLFVSSFGANKYFNTELQLVSAIAGAIALLGCTALFAWFTRRAAA
jgi:dolichyl-phosphate-mannose--protein O-mannosyl transferase